MVEHAPVDCVVPDSRGEATMRIMAAVLREPDQPYSVEELELCDPGPGELVVKVAGVGLSHTDVVPRNPKFRIRRPIVVGHEGSGIVETVGRGVTAVAPGDRMSSSRSTRAVAASTASAGTRLTAPPPLSGTSADSGPTAPHR